MPKMLHIRNVVRITDYLMLSFLTLATGCLADEKDEYNIDWENFFKTTKRPFWEIFQTTKRPFWEIYGTTKRPFWEIYGTTKRPFWERITVPTIIPAYHDSSPAANDMIIFFIVLIVGLLAISLLAYFYHNHSNSSSNSSTNGIRPRVPGAVVHPPPRNHGTLTAPIVPTAPRASIDNPFPPAVAYNIGYQSGQAAYTNIGYQSDQAVVDAGRPGDAPPDYAAVALGDLTATNKSFPTVVPMETPPPIYQDGKPFN